MLRNNDQRSWAPRYYVVLTGRDYPKYGFTFTRKQVLRLLPVTFNPYFFIDKANFCYPSINNMSEPKGGLTEEHSILEPADGLDGVAAVGAGEGGGPAELHGLYFGFHLSTQRG